MSELGLDPLVSLAIEGRLGSFADISTEGCDWSDPRRLSGPPPLRSPWLAAHLGQLLATLQRDQEVERLDLVSVFAAAVELFEPAQQLGGRRAIATDRRLTEA